MEKYSSYLVKAAAVVLILQGLAVVYAAGNSFINAFDKSIMVMYVTAFVLATLFIIAGIGALMGKSWGTIALWVGILFPAVISFARITPMSLYQFIILNTAIAMYLSCGCVEAEKCAE